MSEVFDPQTLGGWIPFQERTLAQSRAHEDAVGSMPRFGIMGRANEAATKVCLFDFWKHPDTVSALGFAFPGVHQITGSCVGAGGGNVAFTLAAVEVIRLGEPERIIVPFWLLPYGRSRFYLGDRRPGEGSTGSTFARAAREDGFLDARDSRLPTFQNSDGLVWGQSVELSWSDGDESQTTSLLPESRKHLVGTTAQCNSADEVRAAIQNGYPCTCASSWGGRMQCRVTGSPEVLLNEHVTTWQHQMSVQAFWEHPSLGELYWIQNQWGLRAHGADPAGGPAGGFWILRKDMDWICRHGEVFAFSQFQGFPGQPRLLDWLI